MVKTIRQTVYLGATPHEVYQALMDSKKHATFTGETAKISPRVGGAFSVFGGWARGKTTRLETDKLIVQAWRSSDFSKDDPDSKVTFRFSKRGNGTRLTFVHSGVPDDHVKDLEQGWNDYYWSPLKEYLKPRK